MTTFTGSAIAGTTTTGKAANAYATVAEVKASAPGGFTGTTSDAILAQLSERASRLIDDLCRRTFYPVTATRYFDTNGELSLWIPDLLAVTSISTSSDYGVTYTALTSSDYVLYGGKELRPGETPYVRLDVSTNGSLNCFEVGEKALKIVGIWGYHSDYANAWEDTGDTVEDAAGMSAVQTTVTVNDIDGADLYGLTPRIAVGNLAKIEDEQALVTSTNTTTNIGSIRRGWNGTTAATHAKEKAIYVWRWEPVVQQAACIQTIRWFKRGSQGYADSGAAPQLGMMMYTQALDPDIATLLTKTGLRRL